MSDKKNVFPKLIFDIYKFKRMWKGHVIINFESQILALFDNSIYKIQYFSLSMLAKNLSNFVSLPLKLDNPYYHNIQTRHQAKWQAYDKLRQMKYSTPFWLLHSQHTHKQLFYLLTLLHFYLDFGFYSTIYSGVFIYCKQSNVLKLYSLVWPRLWQSTTIS